MGEAATQPRVAQAVGVAGVAGGAGYWRRPLPPAAAAGYWYDSAAPSRRRAPRLLHVAGPLLTPLFGYCPGRRLGIVGDLPAGVTRQWGRWGRWCSWCRWCRWCRHPDFAWGAEPALLRPSLDGVRFRVAAISFGDDEAMTKHCT